MADWYRRAARSAHPLARAARWIYRQQHDFSLPLPMLAVQPAVWLFRVLRSGYFFCFRVLFAEPFFRTYCTSVGKNFHTGAHLHWVMGRGRIEIGDNVRIDGRCNFFFPLRYSREPRLTIGDRTGIGHNCSFTVGKALHIGNDCRLGSNIAIFDSPGHPLEAEARKRGEPACDEEVRPVVLEDNCWIGSHATIFPGVRIGANSVVAFGAIVMSDVPPNVVVAGNPARQIAKLPLPR